MQKLMYKRSQEWRDSFSSLRWEWPFHLVTPRGSGSSAATTLDLDRTALPLYNVLTFKRNIECFIQRLHEQNTVRLSSQDDEVGENLVPIYERKVTKELLGEFSDKTNS